MKTWKLVLETDEKYYERLFNFNLKKFIEASEEEIIKTINEAMLNSIDPAHQEIARYVLLKKENYREFCNEAKDIIQRDSIGSYYVYTQPEGSEEYINPGVLNYLYATINEREATGI